MIASIIFANIIFFILMQIRIFSEVDNTTQNLINDDDQNMINISTMDNLNKTDSGILIY